MHVKKIVAFGNHRIERGIAGLVRKSNLQHFTARLSFKHLDGMAQRVIAHARFALLRKGGTYGQNDQCQCGEAWN